MIYRWIHVPRRIFTCSPMAELLSNIGFYSVEQRRIVDIIESQGSGDWLHASRWMKVAGTRWRLMGVNSRYDLLSSVSLSKRIYRLLRILPAWFYLVFNYPQGFRDKGVAAVVSQVNVALFYLHWKTRKIREVWRIFSSFSPFFFRYDASALEKLKNFRNESIQYVNVFLNYLKEIWKTKITVTEMRINGCALIYKLIRVSNV